MGMSKKSSSIKLTDHEKSIVKNISNYISSQHYQEAFDMLVEESIFINESLNIVNFLKQVCGIDILREIYVIRDRAFQENPDIIKIHIHGNIKRIEDGAFDGCNELKTVIIDKGVTVLGENVFSSCEKLERIKLPNTIQECGRELFYDCKKLHNIEFDGTESEFRTLDNNGLDINWMYGSYIDTITCLKDNKVIH